LGIDSLHHFLHLPDNGPQSVLVRLPDFVELLSKGSLHTMHFRQDINKAASLHFNSADG
jgi:hypothetical protein